MDYFKVHIVKTGKPRRSSPNEDYRTFDTEDREFPTLEDARAYVKETYGKTRGAPMYQDTKDNKIECVGRVYGFNNADVSHYPVDKWYEQDWVSITHVTEEVAA